MNWVETITTTERTSKEKILLVDDSPENLVALRPFSKVSDRT